MVLVSSPWKTHGKGLVTLGNPLGVTCHRRRPRPPAWQNDTHKEGCCAGSSYRKKWSSVVFPEGSKKQSSLLLNDWTPSPHKAVPAHHGSNQNKSLIGRQKFMSCFQTPFQLPCVLVHPSAQGRGHNQTLKINIASSCQQGEGCSQNWAAQSQTQ